MEIAERAAPNPDWDINEFTCEKTDVSILRNKHKTEGFVAYSIIDKFDSFHTEINEKAYEIIKKLLV